jgi:hypothetical protein
MLTPGITRYLVVSLAALAAVLAGLGGGWFEGS